MPDHFTQIQSDPCKYDEVLAQTQRFRGRIYLQDGAIKPWQLIDGRHRLEVDQSSWHVLVLDSSDNVCGCARFRQYPAAAGYGDFGVSRSALALSKDWGEMLKSAVESEMALARGRDGLTGEWGGWALDEEVRGTAEALRMTLAAYALTSELGGGIALSCVTRRHGSASILRRMGGRSLECRGIELPAYYDPSYECEMEILSFRSWDPNPRYSVWIDEIRETLCHTPVLTAGSMKAPWRQEHRSRSTATRPSAMRAGALRAVAAG